MDDPFAGDDRQHKSWRDLPPTPLVWPCPPFATAPAGAGASPMPPARPRGRPRAGSSSARPSWSAPSSSSAPGARHRQPPRGAAGRSGRWPGAAGRGGRGAPRSDEPLADTAARLLPRSCRSRPAAGSAPASWRPTGPHPHHRTSSADRIRSRSTLGRHEHLRHRGRGRQVHRHRRHPGRGGRRRSEAPRPRRPRRCAGGRDDDRHREPVRPEPDGHHRHRERARPHRPDPDGRAARPDPDRCRDQLRQLRRSADRREGRAIGINTAIASASGGSDGIGFAVPVDQAAQILDKVKDGTWKPEDNNPADSMDPGWAVRPVPRSRRAGRSGRPVRTRARRIAGAGALRRLGAWPIGCSASCSTSSCAELAPEPAPQPAPEPTPAPDDPNDPGAEAIDRLMQQLMDELLQGLTRRDPGSIRARWRHRGQEA